MILLAAVLVGLAVGLLRGGRWANLQHITLHWGVWAAVALAAQLLVVRVPGEPGLGLRWWVMAGAYGLLAAVVWRNRRLPGMMLFLAGVVANAAVILANGGAMPLTPEMGLRMGVPPDVVERSMGRLVAGAKDVILPQEQAALWFLSDTLFLPILNVAFSGGDVLLALGMIRLVESSLRQKASPAQAHTSGPTPPAAAGES